MCDLPKLRGITFAIKLQHPSFSFSSEHYPLNNPLHIDPYLLFSFSFLMKILEQLPFNYKSLFSDGPFFDWLKSNLKSWQITI